jgi:hypothetical protein
VPHIIITPPDTTPEEAVAHAIIECLEIDIQEARDSLTVAKISQSHYMNINCDPDPTFKVGDKVMLATKNRWRKYMQEKSGHVAKFMLRFNGPYEITVVHPESLNYTLLIPNHRGDKTTTFHMSHLKVHKTNDDIQFPQRALEQPGPIVTKEGSTEFFIEKILDERKRGGESNILSGG